MKNHSFLGKFLFTVCFLSSFLYAAEEGIENTLIAPSLLLGTPQTDKLSDEERSWFDRLNAEKIILLNGNPWEKHHAEIGSYRSLYEAFHLLQEQPTGFQSALENSLNEAFHSDFACKYHVLGLFYQMINRDEEALRAFRRAGKLGDKSSQKLVVEALCDGKLGQGRRPEEERYGELVSFVVERGWKPAQNKAIEALCDGKLGQGGRPKEERYLELVSFAERGWKPAQDKVAHALYNGNLGQEEKPEEERYQKLMVVGERGWNSAQNKVIEALCDGKLGQGGRSGEERYQELMALAERGWKAAQDKTADTLYYGRLGQKEKPEEERYQELMALAERGWKAAQDKIGDAHRYNMLGGASPHWYGQGGVWGRWSGFPPSYPGASRDVPPPYFKKYKGKEYFCMLETLVGVGI